MIRFILVTVFALVGTPARADNLNGLDVLGPASCDFIAPQDIERIRALVRQLDAARFAAREAAQRELDALVRGILDSAPGAAPCLMALLGSSADLSAEANDRLKKERALACDVQYAPIPICDQHSYEYVYDGAYFDWRGELFLTDRLPTAFGRGPTCADATQDLRDKVAAIAKEAAPTVDQIAKRRPDMDVSVFPRPSDITTDRPGCCRVESCGPFVTYKVGPVIGGTEKPKVPQGAVPAAMPPTGTAQTAPVVTPPALALPALDPVLPGL